MYINSVVGASENVNFLYESSTKDKQLSGVATEQNVNI